jgi:hypothetical protein
LPLAPFPCGRGIKGAGENRINKKTVFTSPLG